MTAAAPVDSPPDPSERVRTFLAIFVVVASFVMIGVAWASTGISGAERMAAIFTGLVGLVIGHYFGSRGVDVARRNERQVRSSSRRDISQATEKTREFRSELEENLQELAGQVEAYEEQLTKYHPIVKEYADFLARAEAEPERKVKELLDSIGG
jgi:ABC-type transporter Mla subunit MlaD